MYPATVAHITDGDTAAFRVDQGFHNCVVITARFAGIDTAERATAGGKKASARVRELLVVGAAVVLETFKAPEYSSGEKYGRWLAIVWLGDGSCLNRLLLQEGLAVPYGGGSKSPPPWPIPPP